MNSFTALLLALGSLVLPRSSFASLPTDAQELVTPAACGTLRLNVIAENAIRVRCSTAPSQLPELIYTKAARVPATVGSDARLWWIRTDKIRATIDKRSNALSFYDGKGKLLLEETPSGHSWSKGSGAQAELGVAEVHYKLQAGEHLYGSGQFQDGFLDIARLPRRLVQLNTQIALPFILSNRGYGLLWHQYSMTELNKPANESVLHETGAGQSATVDVTTSAGTQRQRRQGKQFEGSFDAPEAGEYALQLNSGRAMTDRWNLVIDGKPVIDFQNFWLPGVTSTLTYLSAGTHRVAVQANADDHPSLLWGPAQDTTILRSQDSPGVDYTIFAGDADAVISSYRDLAGGTPMLPKWAFGFIQCRERYHSSEEILDTLRQFRKEKLPLDVIVQDWQYWGKYGWNAMKFDERFYPDPARLVQEIHENHAHLMVSVWSRFDPESDVGKEFKEKSYFIPGTTWVDFLNPSAAQLYWQNFSTRMRSLGIDAWWLDATEPENDDLHERTTHAGPGDEYRLVYPLLVSKTVYEGSRKDAPNQRTMILTRSAFLGAQRYGISTWSGDIGNEWETLQRQVTAGLDYMASGMPFWTTDTGGFFRPGKEQYEDPAYHERFLRWMEFSVFSPLLRVHGYQTNTEPWNYGPEMVSQVRGLLDLRYRLLPYIYSQAASVTMSGGTMMRPLVMDFPKDREALDQKYEYMFGPSLLVAPVVKPGVTSEGVYAPQVKGGWYDWWSGKHIAGGANTTLEAPVDRIPVLVRAGSIVPLAPVQQYVGEDRKAGLELRIYPGANGKTTLYDDDGTTYGYEQKQRSLVTMSWDDRTRILTIGARNGSYAGMPSQQRFCLRYFAGQILQEKQIAYSGHALHVHF